MLKRRIYDKLKDTLTEFVYDFDERKLDVGMFGGKIEMKDLILKPKKINSIFEKKNLPFALKAGIVRKVTIEVCNSIFMLFSPNRKPYLTSVFVLVD